MSQVTAQATRRRDPNEIAFRIHETIDWQAAGNVRAWVVDDQPVVVPVILWLDVEGTDQQPIFNEFDSDELLPVRSFIDPTGKIVLRRDAILPGLEPPQWISVPTSVAIGDSDPQPSPKPRRGQPVIGILETEESLFADIKPRVRPRFSVRILEKKRAVFKASARIRVENEEA